MTSGEVLQVVVGGIVAISLGFIQLRMAAIKEAALAAARQSAENARKAEDIERAVEESKRLTTENGVKAAALLVKADHITDLTNSRLTMVTTKLDSSQREVAELRGLVSRLIQTLPTTPGAPLPSLAAAEARELSVDTITTESIITKDGGDR